MKTTHRIPQPSATIRKGIAALESGLDAKTANELFLHLLTLASNQADRLLYKGAFGDDRTAANAWEAGIRGYIREARETGVTARQTHLSSEIARLDREIRESGPRAGTFEHELALLRGR